MYLSNITILVLQEKFRMKKKVISDNLEVFSDKFVVN